MLEKPILVARQLAEVPNQRSVLPNLVVYSEPRRGSKSFSFLERFVSRSNSMLTLLLKLPMRLAMVAFLIKPSLSPDSKPFCPTAILLTYSHLQLKEVIL